MNSTTQFTSNAQKIMWYHDGILSNTDMQDSDVVLMMDAYDVLLSPHIRTASEVYEVDASLFSNDKFYFYFCFSSTT